MFGPVGGLVWFAPLDRIAHVSLRCIIGPARRRVEVSFYIANSKEMYGITLIIIITVILFLRNITMILLLIRF